MAIETLQAVPRLGIFSVDSAPLSPDEGMSLRHLRFDNFPLLPVLADAAIFRESRSMRLATITVICGVSAFAADPALADSCPQLMEKFGDALVKTTADDSVPAEDRTTALALHDEGEALYDAGDDDQCTEKLQEALEILRDS